MNQASPASIRASVEDGEHGVSTGPKAGTEEAKITTLAGSVSTHNDIEACRRILSEGSKSFAAASLLLPARIRGQVATVYAFCRVSDDAVDEGEDMDAALLELHARLDRIYAQRPDDDPVDRGLAATLAMVPIPRAVFLGLLEGYRWDAEERRYETIEDLEAYCARVASTVGVMMTVLMGSRAEHVLARACDLGLAMQLTNIARDVGEDARAGRLYLPRAWLRDAGVEPDTFLANPVFSSALGNVVERLLARAATYYARADLGISMLPVDSRLAIRSARLIYADIGRVIAGNGFDSVSQRAYTTKLRKLWLILRALPVRLWRRRDCEEPVNAQCRFLVEAVTDSGTGVDGDALVAGSVT